MSEIRALLSEQPNADLPEPEPGKITELPDIPLPSVEIKNKDKNRAFSAVNQLSDGSSQN